MGQHPSEHGSLSNSGPVNTVLSNTVPTVDPIDSTPTSISVKRRAHIWALVLCVLGGFACHVPRATPPTPVSPEAEGFFLRALESEESGDWDQALDLYRAATVQSPDYVAAHRRYQNLLLGRYQHGTLIAEYQQFLSEDPDSPIRRYLMARLWSDPERQIAGFESCLAADPGFYFGHIGVGYVSLELGDWKRAESAFTRALKINPTGEEAGHGFLRVVAGTTKGPRADVAKAVAKMLHSQNPADVPAWRSMVKKMLAEGAVDQACRTLIPFAMEARSSDAADLLLEVLLMHGTPLHFNLARDYLFGLGGDFPEDASWARLRSIVLERCGDPRGALFDLASAHSSVMRLESIRKIHRRLLLEGGEMLPYLREVRDRRYRSGFDLGDGGEAAARLDWVLSVMEKTAGVPVGKEACDAIEHLRRLGLVQAAIEVARKSLSRNPDQPEVRTLLRETERHQLFVARVDGLFREMYRSDETPELTDVLNEIRVISTECLNRDVVDPVVIREHFPIGEFLNPDPVHGSGLARYFNEFGTFFMMGRRAFMAPEAYALTRIGEGTIEVDGSPVYRVVGEDLIIKSRVESLGGEIAGFAFESFIVLNVDRVRTAAVRAQSFYEAYGQDPERLLGDSLLRVSSADQATDVREPLSLAVRAGFRAYADHLNGGGEPEQYVGVLLDAVESHERAHILDAARFLPVFDDLGSKFLLLWNHGFSAASVEAWLEERAQALALAGAQNPMSVLANTAAMLPDRTASPPHSEGYFNLARRMVIAVSERSDEFPEIDPDYTILPQLDRLGQKGLRRLGEVLLEEEGEAPPGD